MTKPASKMEAARLNGKTQVDAQRASILDAAEALFLQNGFEPTRMIDIAAAAGLSKMSLYRYFPNRDVIALEIQSRMMNRIAAVIGPQVQVNSPESVRGLVHFMIRNFDTLRDAYRYMGLFDKLYLDNPPDEARTHWTRSHLASLRWNGQPMEALIREHPQSKRILMALSTVVWFLEKLALRGEMTWSDQSVPLEEHLALFEEMIAEYLEHHWNDQPHSATGGRNAK